MYSLKEHIFSLQNMFIQRIQEELNDFKSHWDNHPLESEHNRSPLQLILLRNCDINYDDVVKEGRISNLNHRAGMK